MTINAIYGLDAQGHLYYRAEEWVRADEGVTVIRKVAAGEHDLPYTLYELILAPHQRASLPALQQGAIATIYIIEGTLAVRLGEQTITVNAGGLVQAPAQRDYAMWNPTSSCVRCLVIVVEEDEHSKPASLTSLA